MSDKKDPQKDFEPKPGSLGSVFQNPAVRWAMAVNGIGWAMFAVALAYSMNKDDKAPTPPEPVKVEQSAPVAPKAPAP